MGKSDQSRVLVIGDDMRIFLAVTRALGRGGKRVEALPFGQSPALKSRYVARIHNAPSFDSDPASWREALLALLLHERFDLIIPCSDPAIIFLDAHRERLSDQRVAIPSPEAMDRFYDKEQTRFMAERLGIPVSPAHRLTDTDTAESLIARYGLPVVLKPRRTFFADSSQAHEVVKIAESATELRKVLAKISDRSRYLAEAFFLGDGIGVSVLANRGCVLQAFQHRRLREGKGGVSSLRVSEAPDPALLQACAKIIADTCHTGVCMFEFRHNYTSGQWILIETNARFWGSMGLPLALGVDFPSMLYQLIVDNKEPDTRSYQSGVRSRNLMLDGCNLIKTVPLSKPLQLLSWAAAVSEFALQPVYLLRGTERSDSFVKDDWLPAIWEFTEPARMLSKLFGRRSGTLPRESVTDKSVTTTQSVSD